MNGTPSIEIPGWYINFQAAIIKQLPRPGDLDESIAYGWEKNQGSLKIALASVLLQSSPEAKEITAIPTSERFYFVKAFKVTVPQDYVHGTRLSSFRAKYQNETVKSFDVYNNLITDENFAGVTNYLAPGKTYTVKIFEIKFGATSEECLAKYRSERAFLGGAQGASVVWERNREDLFKGKWYASFDRKENLPVAHGERRVPGVNASSDGSFRFSLGSFEDGRYDSDCLLCFCDEEQPSTSSTT